jgi:hypothetical protein
VVTWEQVQDSEFVTIEHFDFVSVAKIVDKKLNPLLGTITFNMVPYHDTIHPYPLTFDPPLLEFATPEGQAGFRHRWEKLAFAFGLPDPALFPTLEGLNDDDRLIANRFVQVCKRLAKFSAMNGESRLKFSDDASGDTAILVDFPSDESFTAAALFFRQLHSGQESASFEKVQGRFFKAIAQLPADSRDRYKSILRQWVSARGKLMNQLLETIVCRKLAPKGASSAFPYPFHNVRPENLILTFQYGDIIHFSGERENLAGLMGNEFNEAYYKFAVLLAISGLCHLYFGFALLIEAALGSQATG